MRYGVPYKDREEAFETDIPCLVIGKRDYSPGNAGEIIAKAMEPAQYFSEFASSSKSLLFLLCDGTRPTPTALVLEHMFDDIKNHANVSFLIATGTHREPTVRELEAIFGRHYEEFRDRIMVHDAKDNGRLTYIGTTSRGTPVSLNTAVMEADGIVAINSVEPHYFAGFTGGRKIFLPGIAGYDSVERNHSHATEPGAEPMVLDGNPVSEDMFEAMNFIRDRKIFSVQTVVLPDGSLLSAFAGDMDESFRLAVESTRQIYSASIPRKANIVIAAAPPPMDRDLYQSQKALEHGRLALEAGGIMILVSSCWDGIGDTGFYELLSRLGEGGRIEDHLGNNYRLGNHKAARWLSLCSEGSIWSVTELGGDVLGTVGMRGFGTLQEAVDEAVRTLKEQGKEPRINLIPGGSYTVPVVV
jgi:nickel-dependent lactate racemase